MKPRITVVTLGVADLVRSTRFYEEGLGLPRHPGDAEGVTFFRMHAGQILALFGADDLAKDANAGSPPPPDRFRGVTLAHNVGSKEEVDALLGQAVAAGARLAKAGEAPPWGGWSGYFADLDGHMWEVAWQPALDFDDG